MPAPDGYSDSGTSHSGDVDCGVSPSCEDVVVKRTFRPAARVTEESACNSLHTALEKWTRAGFKFQRWGESGTTGLECILVGTIDGMTSRADVWEGEIRLSVLVDR